MAKPAVQWYVYALRDPTTGDVRYVGWTSNPDKRLRTHVHSGWRHKPKTHRACWIRSLLLRGYKPTMEILESGYGDPCPAESRWISRMREAGASLTNATDGGEGAVGYRFSEEGRRKLSESHRGYVMPPEQREKIGAAHRNRPMTPQRLQALRESAVHMRKNITSDSIAKSSGSRRGKKQSVEWVRKRVQNRIGKPVLQSVLEKMKNAARRRCSTPAGLEQARKAAAAARKAMRDSRYKDQLLLWPI